MSTASPTPKGIGCIITDTKGDVVAQYFDFTRDGYGGFKLWEAQKHRAQRFATFEYIRAYTYGDLTSAIKDHLAEQIVRDMRTAGKIKMTFIDVGHGVEDVNR